MSTQAAHTRSSAGLFIPWVIFTSLSLLFVAPMLLKVGPNVVLESYLLGVERIFNGRSPYQAPIEGADWYKYSPLFAVFFLPFAQLPAQILSLIWAALNAGVFWWGMCRFFGPQLLTAAAPAMGLAVFFVLGSMELDGSLRYQQVNAFLVGLMLLGLAQLRERGLRSHQGWIVLSLSANFKLLALAVLAPLGLRAPLRVAAYLLLSLLLPALYLGWGANLQRHIEWWELLKGDMGSAGLLDLSSALKSTFAMPDFWAQTARWLLLAISALVLACRFSYKNLLQQPDALISLALCTVLLVSPRTESPTFVLAAPVVYGIYALLKNGVFAATKRLNYGAWALWALSL